MNEPNESFGALLKRFRQRNALTQQGLGRRASVHSSLISKFEREDRAPPLATVQALADALSDLAEGERFELLDEAHAARRRDKQLADQKAVVSLQERVPLPPPSLSPLGREVFVMEVRELLAAEQGLVAIVGEPAIGKTTVAIEVAGMELLEGNRLVIWADAREREASSSAELETYLTRLLLRGKPITDTTLRRRRLFGLFRRIPLLLLIDNLESATVPADVLDFVGSFPRPTRILITSRDLIPATLGANRALTELTEHDAIALFRRVGARNGQFVESTRDQETIKAICVDLLDGHPGAIEIAGSLWSTWPLQEILRGLHQHRAMQILDDPQRRDVNRSMRLSFGLSFELLQRDSAEAAVLLARLSVFISSFSHRAAAAICEMPDVLRTLSLLVNRSLVRFEHDRYVLHSLVREFAAQQLTSGAYYEERLAEYFLQFAAEYQTDLDRLEDELGNLLFCLEWTGRDLKYRSIMVELADLLSTLLRERGYWIERVKQLTRALEIASLAGEPGDIVKLSYQLGHAYQDQGEYEAARDQFVAGRDLAAQISDRTQVIIGELLVAEAEMRMGNLAESKRLADSVLERSNAPDISALAHSLLANVFTAEGSLGLAQSELEETVNLASSVNDLRVQFVAMHQLIQLDIRLLDFERAERHARDRVTVANNIGDDRHIGEARLGLGMVLALQGEQQEAIESFRDAARRLQNSKQATCLAEAQEAQAMLALWEDRPKAAVEHWISSGSIWRELGNKERAREVCQEAESLAGRLNFDQAERDSITKMIEDIRRQND